MLSKLKRLFGLGRTHHACPIRTRKPRRIAPQVEALETRLALSPVLCDDQFSFQVGRNTYEIPYSHNFALDVQNPDITRVIIALHGVEREATSTFDDVLSAARSAGADGSTLIIAPQFLNEADIVANDLASDFLYWNG